MNLHVCRIPRCSLFPIAIRVDTPLAIYLCGMLLSSVTAVHTYSIRLLAASASDWTNTRSWERFSAVVNMPNLNSLLLWPVTPMDLP